jgi:hypothetical protein
MDSPIMCVETRTTGPEEQSCRRCGGAIRGRRRNGFCSDKCRIATRRQEDAERRQFLLDRLQAAVSDIVSELRSGEARSNVPEDLDDAQSATDSGDIDGESK